MPQDLLAELLKRGVKLRLADGRLDVLAPAGSLTQELRDELRLQRDQLIALLGRAEKGEDLPEISLAPGQRHEPFPLTDMQHAYWVGRNSAVELGGVFTHSYFEFEREELDPQRLSESLRKVIDRHDMLRAVVQPDGKQRILPEVAPYEITVTDLRGASPGQQSAELSRIRAEMSHQSMAPERWPMFDIRISWLDDRRLRLHLNFDNLIVDQTSLSVVFGDWRRFYTEPGWDPEPLQLSYRDYVLAEKSLREGSRYARAKEYWLDRLDQLPAAPGLPLAMQPAQLSHPEFTARVARLPRERWNAIKGIARRRGLTPSAVLMTVFGDVLQLWSKQPAFTLNLTLFNRPMLHPQMSQVVGDFTTVTLLAVDARLDDPFGTRAERLQQRLMRDLEHISYGGVRVLQDRARRLGGGPGAAMPIVFTSELAMTSKQSPAHDWHAFFGETQYAICETPQVWLDHQVVEEHGQLIHKWDAVEALFPDGMLADMVSAYSALLDRLSEGEEAWEASGQCVPLPRWQAEERARANDTAADLPVRTLCELVEERAQQSPDAIAVTCADVRYTYREAVDHAHRLARRLSGLGADRGQLVAVVLEKGCDQAAAALGIMECGAAYLPIDPDWPEARRRNLMEQGGVRIAVASPGLRDRLGWPPDVEVVTLADRDVREAPAGRPDTMPSPDDLAYVIFTSGSTGQPKGVMIDHRGAANTIQDINSRFQVGPEDRVLALSSLSFDLSVYDIFGVMAAGGTAVLPSPAGAHDRAHWTELMRQHGVTIWNSVPALMQAWSGPQGQASTPVEPGLRLVLLSGDWIPVTLPDAIRAQFPQAQVVSLGGATEASIWSVSYPIGKVQPEWSRIPYGKPLANQTLHVLDDWLRPCPVWATGEIYIGGTGVARGYWADPEKTADRFITHPMTGERLYRTGDLGRYLPGGDIEFLGREDFQVKLNGYRIELGEIAAALRRQPAVGEALVTVETNPATGTRQLIAWIVRSAAAHQHAFTGREPADGDDFDPAALRKGVQDLLPDHMVPRHYVAIEEVPLSANGKVDLSALPKFWDGSAPAARAAPRDETEVKLLKIWQETLGRDDFGVEDNLFELGGDSLHAVHILGRLQEELGMATSTEEGLHILFDCPTIAELAEAMREPSEA
jgi:pyochelin synthetase